MVIMGVMLPSPDDSDQPVRETGVRLDQQSFLLDLFDPTAARHKFLAIIRAAIIGYLCGKRGWRACIGHVECVEVLTLPHGACLYLVQRVEIILPIFDIGFARIHLCIKLLQAVQAFQCLWFYVVVLRAGSQQYYQRKDGQSNEHCRGSVHLESDAFDFAMRGQFRKGT